MNRKQNKIVSLVMAFFMMFSVILSTSGEVKAQVQYNNDKSYVDLLKRLSNEVAQDNEVSKVCMSEEDKIVTFIVEVEGNAIKDYAGNESLHMAAKDEKLVNKVLQSQKYFKDEIKKINGEAVFTNEYVLLINGFSVKAAMKDMDKIKNIKGVKHVSIEKEYTRDVNHALDIGKIQQVYEEYGYKGEGMVISVIDSGIDYTHKDMVLTESGKSKAKLNEKKVEDMNKNNPKAKGKYYTEKIPYGYNFIDKNHEIIDKAAGNVGYMHGMHVAGIIGANCSDEKEMGNHNGVRGVAPEAQLLAMKVFSNNPQMSNACESDVIAAIEDSVAHGADVINMSISGSAGFQNPEDGQQRAIDEAVKRGVMVIVAGGNGYYSTYPKKYPGINDTSTIGAPGVVHDSLQVASLNNSISTSFLMSYHADHEEGKIPYAMTDGDIRKLTEKYEIVDCNLGRVDGKNNIDDFKGKNLKNKVALIKRGEIEFKDKKINAQDRGAVGVIIYNVDKDETILEATAFDKNVLVPSIFIKNSDGVKLKNLCTKGVKVSFENQILERPNDEAGAMSDFSSWGPAPNLDLKPDITGVGGAIWSTVNDNSYKNMSGTSMATPYVTGTSALLMQHINQLNMNFVNDKDKVKLNKTLLMNTAEIKINKGYNVPYSPRQQGAGLVNIKDALQNKVTVTYQGDPSASLGQLTDKRTIAIDIKNHGQAEETYRISNPYGVLTECEEGKESQIYDVKLHGASLEFDKQVVTVKPGETITVNATLKIDHTVTKDRFVEGYICLDSENNAVSLSMPYMGYYGDWSLLSVMDKPIYTGESAIGETTLVSIVEGLGGYQSYYIGSGKESKSEHFAINPDDSYSISNAAPQLTLLRNAKHLKVDVTDKNGKVIRVLYEGENLRKDVFAENSLKSRVQNQWKWDGTVYDAEKGQRVSVPEGQYEINIRAMAEADNAKEQIISFPVKVDKTSPILKHSNIVTTDSLQCKLQLEASDGEKGAGISDFVFIVNDKDYVDSQGKKSFKLEEKEPNKYCMYLQLPSNGNPIYRVYMGCVDYARNMTPGETTIVNTANSHLKLTLDKKQYDYHDEIKLNYVMTEPSALSQIDHYEVCLDNGSKVVYSGKNLSYTLSKLQGGEHCLLVKAMNSKNQVVDANAINFNVNKSPSKEYETRGISIAGWDNNGIVYENDYGTVAINITNITEDDKDVTLMMCVYDEKGNMINSSLSFKTIGAHEEIFLKNSIYIENGSTVKVFIWDNIESQIPYIDEPLQYAILT